MKKKFIDGACFIYKIFKKKSNFEVEFSCFEEKRVVMLSFFYPIQSCNQTTIIYQNNSILV